MDNLSFKRILGILEQDVQNYEPHCRRAIRVLLSFSNCTGITLLDVGLCIRALVAAKNIGSRRDICWMDDRSLKFCKTASVQNVAFMMLTF